ncbi:MAG: type I methionyl aminopeptidase [Candidatus Omnitrophica bacterium]|nr:type I methionyl aminopeptidase [Candidatus Omnitrophota bacterium]
MIQLKSRREYSLLKESADVLKEVFEELEKYVGPGVTTAYLDKKVETAIKKKGCIPAFKNYKGFPASICASINEEVVHGIPSGRRLIARDIVSIDIGVLCNGYYSDAARTYPIGVVSEIAQNLISVTKASLYYALSNVKTGMQLGDLSYNVQAFVERNGFSVVRDFVGHGIGQKLHEDPQVPNFGTAGTGIALEEGLALAVEPMVNEGEWKVQVMNNKWTVVTCDGKLSAHHEETIFFNGDGPEVLTA